MKENPCHRKCAVLASMVITVGSLEQRPEPGEEILTISLNSSGQVPAPGTHLPRADFDVEVAPLVGNLEDLGPGEAIDAQPVPVDEEAIGTDAQHDVNTL